MHFPQLFFTILTVGFATCFEECEEDYCPPSGPAPTKLSFGNIAPLVGRDPATGCYCREQIGLLSLCYGRTQCTSMTQSLPIRNTALKLTNTNIKILGPGDFPKLGHLVELQIEGNYKLERILNGTFGHLNNLVNLSICFNGKLKVIEKDAFMGLTALEQLFLNNNALESLYDITISLSPLVVPRLSTLMLDSNIFPQISDQDFKPMVDSRLQVLSLNLCRIEYLHPKALVVLKKLQHLYLGRNIINSTVLTDMLENMLSVGIDLKSLHLFYMGFKKAPPRAMMEIIAKSNISNLNLSENQFEVINRDVFPVMPRLKLLDLRKVLALEITDDAFGNLPNLNTLLISGNRLSQIPKGVLNLRNLTFLDMQENSEVKHILYFQFSDVDFKNMTNLRYLNLGFNGLSHLFDTSFKGLKNLRVLILNNSSIYHIEKHTFASLRELKVLNLANNLMVHEEVPDVFFALTKLEVLLLSGCKFKYVAKRHEPFKNLKSLKVLMLDRNMLKTIAPKDFQNLKALQKIDLSFNELNSWEQKWFQGNVNLKRVILAKNKLTDITVAMLEDFASIGSIDLDQNAILCKCMVTYKSFKKWYRSTNNDIFKNGSIFDPPIYCGYPDKLDNVSVVDFLTKTQYGEHICSFRPERIYLFLPLICTILVLTGLSILAFWYRWHIRYWLFLSKLYLSRKGKIKSNNNYQGKCFTNYEYDAFVSYSTEDRDFVVKLVSMMENYEPFLRLCVYERDFQIGTIISESVLESVAKSRKTVLIVSDNYAKSQWCRWESQICEHHRLFFENEDGEYVDDSLILVKLSAVSASNLTPTLKYLLKTRIYLQWGWDEREQDNFWNKLRNTLGPPIILSEITHM